MIGRLDVQQATRALMVLKTLDVLGPLHGYGIARRTALLKLEQEECIRGDWGISDSNRKAKILSPSRSPA